MNKTKILETLEKQCKCYFDNKNQEYLKCTTCEARDYILLLADTLERVGCQFCNKALQGLLQ
jgi:hypothetical protein